MNQQPEQESGCYPGCFYYSDSCFRADCLKKGNTAQLTPVPMPLFPTLGSLNEVVTLADSKLPITSKNEVCSLLYTYHNTLLKALQQPK